jgi:hypothetical protein
MRSVTLFSNHLKNNLIMNLTRKILEIPKFKYFLSLMIVVSFYACDKSIETSRVYLTDFEKGFMPYYLGQKVGFVHSNGYNFDFTVNDVKTSFDRQYDEPKPFFDFSGNYIAYQTKSLKMSSTYPKMTLEVNLGTLNSNSSIHDSIAGTFNYIYTDSIKTLSVYLNNHTIYLDYLKNGNFIINPVNEVYYDSMNINGKKYFNVIESQFSYQIDTLGGSLKSVVCNSKGLLQIKLRNNETFSIK